MAKKNEFELDETNNSDEIGNENIIDFQRGNRNYSSAENFSSSIEQFNFPIECYQNQTYFDKTYPLTRGYLLSTIELCKSKNNWSALCSLLEATFSSKSNLFQSFLKGSDKFVEFENPSDNLEKAESEDNEKFLENYSMIYSDKYTVDVKSVRESFIVLFNLNNVDFFSGIKKGVNQLIQHLKRCSRIFEPSRPYEIMNIIIILFEIPYLTDPIKFEDILPQVCEIVSLLTIDTRSILTEIFAKILKEKNRLIRLHQILQQRITLRLLTTEYDSTYVLNEDPEIINTVLVLQCVYYASILAGNIDSVSQLENERIYNMEIFSTFNHDYNKDENFENMKDEMSKLLSIHSMDCRDPLIPYQDFINETLNDCINIENDYVCYKSGKGFSFVKFAFLLTTHTKAILLFYDNRIRMRNEFNNLFLSSIMEPFKLTIDREHLVDDALNGLEFTISNGTNKLKRRLYIEFKNEETIDEGGVSKEFFQLIVEKIFNPDYGMFVYNEETNMFWFNPFPMEDMYREYKLIGIILGLAIYNNVILDLKLPPVLYRKLMGKLGNFEDLKLTYPSLAMGLIGLLECDYEEVSSIVDQNFQIGIKDSFGNIRVEDIKTSGSNIKLTAANREEYVKLYSNYLLNDSVKNQFNAFYEGFQMVVNESPLSLLFRPEEIELLVCGNKNVDFLQLEKVTKYDGGFTSNSNTIINFWEIVHKMTKEQHSNLLQFSTGSDRIPVGGMQKMEFKIIRHGSDTNRLPTAQTCFNTLLLPDYCSKEKLKQCLLKAISYSKGFGIR